MKNENVSRMSRCGDVRVRSIERYEREPLIEHKIEQNGGGTCPEQVRMLSTMAATKTR